jgi:aminoglycoside phosphotransferase (APT) family kinase protein
MSQQGPFGGIDEQRVGAWLAQHVPGAALPFRYDLITGGRSNLTYRVTGAYGRGCIGPRWCRPWGAQVEGL